MKLMESEKTQNQNPQTQNKGGTSVEIRNLKPTRLGNLYQRIWKELTEKTL